MKQNKLLSITLVFVLSLTLFSQVAVAAQALDNPKPACNPRAARLAEWMGVDCLVLVDYQAQGVSLGLIWQAYAMSQVKDGPDWTTLLAHYTDEARLGWGVIRQAYRIAMLMGVGATALLEQRGEGMGWGEILQLERQGPGKPPWAGGPKEDKEKHEKPGKPKESDEPDQAGKGPPDWARPGKPPKAKP